MKKLNELQSYLTRLRGLMLTLIILCSIGSGNVWGEVWVKVTAAPTSWAGEYLLVYESSSTAGVAWTGVDAQNCNTSVTISSETISTKPASAVSLTVAAITGGYSIKVNGGTNDGKYLGRSADSNGMNFGTSAVVNTFGYDGSNSCVTITSAGGAIMRYNNTKNNYRFRYFKSSTYTSQQPVQLYRKAYKVTYDKNGGTGTMTDSNSPYAPNATVTVKNNSFTAPTGQTFNGWNTVSGGGGTSYAAGATFTITADVTLYAQWITAASCTTNATVSGGSLKGSVSSSSEATAQCTGGITSLGSAGCSITSYGFAVGTSTNPTIGGTLTGTGKTYEVGTSYTTVNTAFEKLIDGLSASTKYYVRPYATNGNGTAYGTEFNFTTLAACTAAPTVTAGSTGTVTSTTAVVNCSSGLSALGTGGCTVTSYGFVYGTSENPTTANSTNEVGTSYTTTGTSFNTTLTSLTEGQLYYVRPYATNGYGTGYGTQTSFGTPKITTSLSTRNFGDRKVNGGPYTMTFKVSGVYLQSDISIAKSGTNQAMFSIDKATISQTDGTAAETTITVSYSPTAAGSHSATLTLTSTNATSKTVTLTGTGVYVDTFIDVLQSTTGYTEGSPHTESSTYSTPTLTDKSVATSGTCEQQHWHFVGWITADKYEAGTAIADGDIQTPTSASNATYYAVWAKGSGSSTDKTITIDKDTLTSYTTVNKTIGGITFKSTGNWGFPGKWSTYEYLQGANGKVLYNDDAFPGYIKSITITPQSPAGVSGYAQLAVGTTKQPTDYSSNITSTSTTNYTSSNNYTYLAIYANAATALASISITYTVSSYTYSDYKANCCIEPTLAFGASPYAVIRQDIQGASTTTWAEVDVTFTSDNTTGAISATTYTDSKTVYSLSTWQSRETTGGSLCATTQAYFEVLTQPSGETPGTGKFHVKTTSGQTGQGTYRIAITQASTDEDHGNFCEKTVYGFVDVTLRDKFVDKLNDNGTVNKDGHGAQLATPLLSELGTQVENACHSEGRKLKGWIKETDLKAQYETGNSTRVQTIDGLCESCDSASDQKSLVVAPGENITTSGATWYAVWAYER